MVLEDVVAGVRGSGGGETGGAAGGFFAASESESVNQIEREPEPAVVVVSQF